MADINQKVKKFFTNRPIATDIDRNDSSCGQLFITSLPGHITNEMLFKYFSQFGEVLQANVRRRPGGNECRGFGFVAMTRRNIASRILRQYSHAIEEDIFEVKAFKPINATILGPKIYVGNVPAQFSRDKLLNYFSRYAEVENVYYVTGNAYAFVTFARPEDAVFLLCFETVTYEDGLTFVINRARCPDNQLKIQQSVLTNSPQQQKPYQQQQQQQFRNRIINSLSAPPSPTMINPLINDPFKNDVFLNKRQNEILNESLEQLQIAENSLSEIGNNSHCTFAAIGTRVNSSNGNDDGEMLKADRLPEIRYADVVANGGLTQAIQEQQQQKQQLQHPPKQQTSQYWKLLQQDKLDANDISNTPGTVAASTSGRTTVWPSLADIQSQSRKSIVEHESEASGINYGLWNIEQSYHSRRQEEILLTNQYQSNSYFLGLEDILRPLMTPSFTPNHLNNFNNDDMHSHSTDNRGWNGFSSWNLNAFGPKSHNP